MKNEYDGQGHPRHGGVVDLSEVDTDECTAPPVLDRWTTRPPGPLLPEGHGGG